MVAGGYIKVALLTVGAALLAGAPAEAAFPGHEGSIAYSFTHRDARQAPASSQRGIYDDSGDGARPLIGCSQTDGQPDQGDCAISYLSPAYSADGKKIVFDSGGVLAVMNADGTAFRRLPRLTNSDTQPAWSPGGSRIIFTGHHGTGASVTQDIYTVDPLGGHLTRFTQHGGSEAAWSTKGTIAFDRGQDIYTVRADGRDLRRLTYRGGTQPDWSPHATKLVFTRGGRTGFLAYTVRADGRKLHHLNTSNISAQSPAWSPDGRAIAIYASYQGIFAIPVHGGPPSQVAQGYAEGDASTDSADPTWQPRH